MGKLYKKIDLMYVIVITTLIVNILFNIAFINLFDEKIQEAKNEIYIIENQTTTQENIEHKEIISDGVITNLYQVPETVIHTGNNLGQFKITAYCPCKICCGNYSTEVTGKPNTTASGTIPTANNTIAADINIIPFGSKVKINDTIYTVEDTGSAVKGKVIDIYFDNHEQAKNFGKQYLDVYLIE